MVNYTNTASTAQLSAPITAGATSCTVSSYNGFPASPYWAEIARGTASAEVVLVTNVAGSTLTITRGQDGTVASSHSAGDILEHIAPAKHFVDTELHIDASTGVHGASGSVVGTTDVQSLTNKNVRGAFKSVFSDADPAGITNRFESQADSAAAMDGFVHTNTAGDAARRGFLLTQAGTPRFEVFNNGKVKVTPSATPGFQNTGTTQLDGNATVGGTLGVTGVTTLSSAGVTGNATVGGTLGVTGTTTLGTTNAGAVSASSLASSGAVTGASAAITNEVTSYGGRLIPAVASTGSIGSPATNQVAFQTSDGKFYKYNGSIWVLVIPLPDVQVFTSTGSNTWNKPSGLTWAVVEVQGAGAAGGGADPQAGGNGASGGGGGGGGFGRKLFPASTLASSETVLVGAGGAASTPAGAFAGGNGGNSVFANSKGYAVTGNGGTGGTGGPSSGAAATFAAGGAGGTASGGDFNVAGGNGANGVLLGGVVCPVNRGGDAQLGFGGAAPTTTGSGNTGKNYGGGSSGATNLPGAGAALASTAGAQGIVIVTHYYF